MHDLIPLTPLGSAAPRVERHGPVTLAEVTDRALASVAARLGQEPQAAALIEGLIGAPAPGPGRMAGDGVRAAWLGPDQWMLEAPYATHEDLAQLVAALGPSVVSVTEQSDAWCRFDLTGPDLWQLFERLCPVPLRGAAGGEATRTTIEHLGCLLLHHGPAHVTVLGPRSSAGSLHHALMVALRSVF